MTSDIDTSEGERALDPATEVFVDGEVISKGNTFFRGDFTVFHPRRPGLHAADGLARHLMRGWTPDVSAAKAGDRIVALGADIAAPIQAAAIAHGLADGGAPGWCAEEFAHAHGLRRALEASLDGVEDEGLAVEGLAELAAAIRSADVILVCLAQSARFVTADGKLVLGASPSGDGALSAQRVFPTHEETVADLARAYELLRTARPEATIVLAASPSPAPILPIDEPALVAASADKATVRSAVDEVLRTFEPTDARLRYFPAFETALVPFGLMFLADRRTVAPHVLDVLGTAFARHFGVGVDDAAVSRTYLASLEIDASLVSAAETSAVTPPLPDALRAWPDEAALLADTTLEQNALIGLTPPAPIVDAEQTLIAFGSCFALNISRYLNAIGYNVATKRDSVAYVSSIGDGMVNTHAILQQFEWAWEGKIPAVAELWHDARAREFGYDERVRLRTREIFDVGDVFIITLGLSEIWYDEPTDEVFWRAVPAEAYDASRHKFRVASQAESLANLHKIHALIRKHRPAAKILFTLSPIPLTATFRGRATIAASAVSKAILRSAVHEFFLSVRRDDPNLFYFPAFEVVTHFREPYGDDLRHPLLQTISLNMKLFERHFCDSGVSDEAIAAMLDDIRRVDQALAGPNRNDVLLALSEEAKAWAAEESRNSIQSIAIMRAKEDVTLARRAHRDMVVEQREADRNAKRAAAAAARQEAAASRRADADARRAADREARTRGA